MSEDVAELLEELADPDANIDLPELKSKTPKKTLLLPELPQVNETLSDAEINRVHLQMSNLELQMIYHALPQVKSLANLTKLIDTSMKAVKHQRDLLCLPYGYTGKAERKDVVFPPVDD
jgi:hypothetical protein